MIHTLHLFLALASAAVVALAGLEAGLRLARNRKPGTLAARLAESVLLILGITAASGLGMFVGGARPHEGLHLLYAGLAFAAMPVTDMLAGRLSPRARALASIVAALIGLVLLVRLFMTG
jgi:hypothetical protein